MTTNNLEFIKNYRDEVECLRRRAERHFEGLKLTFNIEHLEEKFKEVSEYFYLDEIDLEEFLRDLERLLEYLDALTSLECGCRCEYVEDSILLIHDIIEEVKDQIEEEEEE